MLTIASGPWDRLERAGDLNPVTPAPDGLPDGRLRMLRSFDPALDGADGADLDVPDPYFGDGDDFARVPAMVETACDGLVDHIRPEVGARQERATGT